MIHKSKTGFAALIAIVAITLFLVSVSFTIVNRSGSSTLIGQYEAQATKAQFLADAGVQDALMRLARNKNYNGTFTISDTGWTVNVEVTSGSPMIIIATSTVTIGSISVGRTIRAETTLDSDGVITQILKSNL